MILRVPTTKFSPAARLACCNACNGYVTVRKRSVFVFCLGGPGAPDPGGGGALSERSKTLRPVSAYASGLQRALVMLARHHGLRGYNLTDLADDMMSRLKEVANQLGAD